MLNIYVCGKIVKFLYKNKVHSGEPNLNNMTILLL